MRMTVQSGSENRKEHIPALIQRADLEPPPVPCELDGRIDEADVPSAVTPRILIAAREDGSAVSIDRAVHVAQCRLQRRSCDGTRDAHSALGIILASIAHNVSPLSKVGCKGTAVCGKFPTKKLPTLRTRKILYKGRRV